jgi:hypothetical protein
MQHTANNLAAVLRGVFMAACFEIEQSGESVSAVAKLRQFTNR